VLPRPDRGVQHDELPESGDGQADRCGALSTTEPKKYQQDVYGFINMAFEEVPRVPLAQPNFDVAMQKSIKGYTYWFHLQADYRGPGET